MSERTNVWRCMFVRLVQRAIFAGYAESVDFIEHRCAWDGVFRLVGYSYEDVIGPVDSFRVTHLTCNMIQTRWVVITSSIGSSVRAISGQQESYRLRHLCPLSFCLCRTLLFVSHFEVCPTIAVSFFSRRTWAIFLATHSLNIHKHLHFLD